MANEIQSLIRNLIALTNSDKISWYRKQDVGNQSILQVYSSMLKVGARNYVTVRCFVQFNGSTKDGIVSVVVDSEGDRIIIPFVPQDDSLLDVLNCSIKEYFVRNTIERTNKVLSEINVSLVDLRKSI